MNHKLLRAPRPATSSSGRRSTTRLLARRGHSGQAVSESGPANTTFDNTPPGGSPGILFGFVGGKEARSFRKLGRAARRKAVLDNFVTYYGPEAASPKTRSRSTGPRRRGRAAARWDTRCATSCTATGPPCNKPYKHVHWAGTETADYWNGYMDGAVRSGERAAKEVLKALRK